MRLFHLFYPGPEERQHLGRFYWSSLLSELLNVVLPFQFVYLLLVFDNPSWAPIPLMVESLVVFFMEIPTGIVADKWGRKVSSMLGDTLSAVGWLLVPLTTVVEGPWQLAVACSAFALEGLGQTLVSGAEQAWVMDNLIAVKQPGLVDKYFARQKSLGSLGGIFAGVIVWILLLVAKVDAKLINGLWYASALGQLISVAILIRVPEHVLAPGERDEEDAEFLASGPDATGTAAAFKTIIRNHSLAAFAIVTLIVAFSHSIIDDAFQISMVTKGLNPRELAPLGIVTDVLGFVAPMLMVVAVRRFGAPMVLATALALIACLYSTFFLSPGLVLVVGLFLLTNLLRDLWTPVANAMLQSFIPSSNRATISSIINQFSELFQTAGLGVFTLMLGRHAEELRASVPDLVEAFAGVPAEPVAIPLGLFGLPVYDAALVCFSLIGIFAAAILWLFPWKNGASQLLRSPDDLGLLDPDAG